MERGSKYQSSVSKDWSTQEPLNIVARDHLPVLTNYGEQTPLPFRDGEVVGNIPPSLDPHGYCEQVEIAVQDSIRNGWIAVFQEGELRVVRRPDGNLDFKSDLSWMTSALQDYPIWLFNSSRVDEVFHQLYSHIDVNKIEPGDLYSVCYQDVQGIHIVASGSLSSDKFGRPNLSGFALLFDARAADIIDEVKLGLRRSTRRTLLSLLNSVFRNEAVLDSPLHIGNMHSHHLLPHSLYSPIHLTMIDKG